MEFEGKVERFSGAPKTWKILSAEDDISYQSALMNSLKTLNYSGREVEFLAVNSAQEASTMLALHPDISVLLLDVIMESDDAGLRLVRSIREGLGNHLVRIILLTGQPGMMPLDDLMSSYDIDDYWNKSDLTHDHLQTLILGNLKTWEHLTVIQQARHGMQMLIESSQRISSKYDLKSYTQSILEELLTLFGFEQGGIVCISYNRSDVLNNALVFAAAGEYKAWANQYVSSIEADPMILEKLAQSLSTQRHLIDCPISVLYFSSEQVDDRSYAVVVNHSEPLQPYQIDMLQVFGENVNVGFHNVALHGRLSELAYYDNSTGLHNKNWMLRQLANMSDLERENSKLLMLYVEELSYSEVLFGVEFGRLLMMHLSAHLKASFVKTIDIALYERDTLLLLVYDVKDYTREDLAFALHPQLYIEGSMHAVDIVASLVKISDVADQTPSQIIGIAKSFLEQAKHDQVEFGEFNAQELLQLQERYELLSKLRTAIINQELFIHLQPKIRLRDGLLIGFEVLVRWRDAEGKFIGPDQFIPLAETAGLVDRIDEQVTRLACDASKRLQAESIDVPLAVNVAGSEISRPEFIDNFLGLLTEQGVDPRHIDIEVTETQLIEEWRAISSHLERCQQLGIKVSIDDFGAGYSSLSYLSTLKVAELKIDRQFVMRMESSEQDLQIVKMIINLGHLLNMSVLAEGIETQSQYDTLLELGCDAGQGYFIARPMDIDRVLDWHHSTEVCAK